MPNNNVLWTVLLVLGIIALIVFLSSHVTFR